MNRSWQTLASTQLLCLLLAIAFICAVRSANLADPADNLLNNGSFTRGSGNSVDGWRIDAWILTPGTTDYGWVRPQNNQPAAVELFSRGENDARWVQQLSLKAGWYYISAEVKVQNVPSFKVGANVSVLEDSIMSASITGSHHWQRIGLYLKIGAHGADVDIALRLGGYGSLTRGQAFFRNASVVKIPAPPAATHHVFDLSAIRKAETPPPIGQPWTLVATFALLAGVAVVGWRLMSQPPVTVASRAPKRSPRPRKSRRSHKRA